MKKLLIFLAFVMLFVACDNSNNLTVKPEEEEEILTSDEHAALVSDKIVEANTNFAFKTFKKISELDTAQNSCYSPLSLSLVLQILYNGSGGETAAELADLLLLNGIEINDLNEQNSHLIRSLIAPDEGIKIEVANSIWCNSNFNLVASFVANMQNFYLADIFNYLDVNAANDWVKEKTHGLIDKITDESPEEFLNHLVVLLNVIYFKGDWTYKFNPQKTYPSQFYLENESGENSYRITDIMHSSGLDFTYYFGEEFSVARLPYGADKIAMYILLPNKVSEFSWETETKISLDELISQLDYETWTNCLDNFISIYQGEYSLFEFALPKFKLENTFDLKKILKALGVHNIFGSPDFSNLFDGGGYVGKVAQKTLIKVDEFGTEAAAVTQVNVDGEIPQFKANRPFIYILQDDRSKSILFMGKVTNPSGFKK